RALVVAVKIDFMRGKAAGESGVKFSSGNHVKAQLFFMNDAVQGGSAKGFAGVDHQVLRVGFHKGVVVFPASLPDQSFIVNNEGRAELLAQVYSIATADF